MTATDPRIGAFGPAGGRHDLIVLANRTDDDWQLLATVGLDAPLDAT